ncbi:MAG TPA: ParB/RepB/Spo0J family partition protein [Acidobacteriaceae bacterium]|nr:ParB/RepB/Spo0J family partition protein [Acidobacteriaceae bacterium]
MRKRSAGASADQYERIPVDLIDEPAVPERETMDEQELGELAMNIREVGLIQPLTVKPVGKRFEVIAGHRRLLACRIVEYSPVPCIVKAPSEVDPLALLIAENHHREDPNPVEEARFYQRVLVEQCGNDVDVLCLKVRRKRGYVEDRLLLLMGHESVVEALHQRKISIAVARELNKCKQPIRLRLLLDTAIQQGATARQVAEWRKEQEGQPDIQLAAGMEPDPSVNPAALPAMPFMTCLFCEDGSDTHLMEIVYLHKPCARIVRKMLGRIEEQPSATSPAPPLN